MKAWRPWGLVLACGLSAAGCKEEPASAGTPRPSTGTPRTQWVVNGVLDAPHYSLDGTVHAHVKAKFRMQVDTKQSNDADTDNGPVPNKGLFELLAFEATDQHWHPPLPDCIPASFGSTYAWQPGGGLYQVNVVGFRVNVKMPSYQLPIGEGNCDTLGAARAAKEEPKDILFWVPQEVLAGQQPPGSGFVTVGEELSAAQSTDTLSDKDWVFTWTTL